METAEFVAIRIKGCPNRTDSDSGRGCGHGEYHDPFAGIAGGHHDDCMMMYVSCAQ